MTDLEKEIEELMAYFREKGQKRDELDDAIDALIADHKQQQQKIEELEGVLDILENEVVPMESYVKKCREGQDLQAKLDKCVESLEKADLALNDIVVVTASDFCSQEKVLEVADRVTHGTLAYIADTREAIQQTLQELKEGE